MNGKKNSIRFLFGTICTVFKDFTCSRSGNDAETETRAVRFLEDGIHCNMLCSIREYTLKLHYLYQGKMPDIAFTKINGEPADAILKERYPDIFTADDHAREKAYQGYRHGLCGFTLDLSVLKDGETFSVDSITLLVNGEETVLDTAGRIRITGYDVSDPEYSLPDVETLMRTFLVDRNIGKRKVTIPFAFLIKAEICLKDIAFRDYIQVENIGISVTGEGDKTTELSGELKELAPLRIPADRSVQIRLEADVGMLDDFSDYDTSLLFIWENGQGQEVKDCYEIHFASLLSCEDKFVFFIDRMESLKIL